MRSATPRPATADPASASPNSAATSVGNRLERLRLIHLLPFRTIGRLPAPLKSGAILAGRAPSERERSVVISQTYASPGLTRVATYRRKVRASLRRVWENVYDWEHLPWLHGESFCGIELEDSGAWGWRARIRLQPVERRNEIRLELVTERAVRRYVSRTLEGTGKGGEIWTHLDPVGEHETHIAVEFWLPGVRPESAERLGAGFVRLYTRLWDEDESMMMEREARLRERAPRDAADPVSLGPLAQLRSRLPLVVDFGGHPFRIVELDGELIAHSTICPHLLGPLGCVPFESGRIRCPWHGYEYDARTGRSAQGRAHTLERAPRIELDDRTGEVRLLPAD